MKKITVDETGNKLMLDKFKNLNLTHIFSLDDKFNIYMHSIDVRGKGINNLYAYLKGLDEKNTKYIVISDYPVNYCCRTFDKDKIDSINLVRQLLIRQRLFCLDGKIIEVDKEALQNFDKEKYEKFYKEYVELEKISSECPCDCIYLKKCDENNVYVIKSGFCVLKPKRLLVENVLYVILSLQRYYGSKRYFDEIYKSEVFYGLDRAYFCTGHSERKDKIVKGNISYELHKVMGGFDYPYGALH